MQAALLLFIVVISLAIGFFLGLLLISGDNPLAKKISKSHSQEEPEPGSPPPDLTEPHPESLNWKKPTEGSRAILTVWQEEGEPPMYEWNGAYYHKEALPNQISHILTVQQTAQPILPGRGGFPSQKDLVPIPAEGPPEEGGEFLSVISEIDRILQTKLEHSPLAERGIHLMENHQQEIRIWVGLDSYDSINDIPDGDVRELINAAVKEWENRNE